MNYLYQVRVVNPTLTTLELVKKHQVAKYSGDLAILKFSSADTNYNLLIHRVVNIRESKSDTREFISFYEVRYQWTKQEIGQAEAFVVNPFRRYYNEVEGEKTTIDVEPELDRGYKYVQRSPLVLPRLKGTKSEIVYLSNGSLVVNGDFHDRLKVLDLSNLSFIPVQNRTSQDTCHVLDFCIGESGEGFSEGAKWFQVISKTPASVDSRQLDPFGLTLREDVEPYTHVFPGHISPLVGTCDFSDGGFSNKGFGSLPMGLWRFYRPLIISKRLLEVFMSAKQVSLTFDPFFKA